MRIRNNLSCSHSPQDLVWDFSALEYFCFSIIPTQAAFCLLWPRT